VATIAHWRIRAAHPARRAHAPREERPFWEVVLLLYGGIFLLAVLMTAVCFTAAWLVTGRPY
jgi:hypothetical protein